MRKLHKLIISSYLGPFIITFFITLFILVMQFLWKYIDDLVGKGLEWDIVAELLFYASANLVPMALPLAILLSSIMTFGNLGEHYELVAMKSAGLSLQRIMLPLIFVITLTSIGAFFFSNNVWPVANLKFASLLYDIRHKKPAIDIKAGVYYKGIEGWVIRVGSKDDDGQNIHDVYIYDHSDRKGGNKVLHAEHGRMAVTENERYLEVTMFNGTNYEEIIESTQKKKKGEKRQKNFYPLVRTQFDENIIRMDLAGFQLKRSDEDLFKDNYQMLSMQQLEAAVDTLYMKLNERQVSYDDYLDDKFIYIRDSLEFGSYSDSLLALKNIDNYAVARRANIIETAISITRSNKTFVHALANEFKSRKRSIVKHDIEWHRKLTLSFACFVLFFIGAPLGAIIRKGGLGLPVVVSVGFFLIFHVLSITGEKFVKQEEAGVFEGMWLATFVLLPIGVFLTYKATTDSPLMDMDSYSRVIQSLFRKKTSPNK